jgi:hypothetical protein
MQLASLFVLLIPVASGAGQKPLPPLVDGTVINEHTEFRQDGPLSISGRVKLTGISLDLRGPIRIAAGADLELEDVQIKVSDPPGTANGTSNLHCDGPATLTIRHSTMDPVGSAHPIWWLRGDLSVVDFQTTNSEFHLDHAKATLEKLTIFELEISHASQVTARHLRLVFLSTHTGDDEKLMFSDIPADQPFSQRLRMGSLATADLTDTVAQLFLLYVHGRSDVTLQRIGRAQLSIAPTCHGNLKLPHGLTGLPNHPMVIPEAGVSDCPFRLRLEQVNADTWDVYASGDADLTFSDSVIDELTETDHAKVTVHNSDVYADWLSLSGNARLQVDRSTVGAHRLAAQRPDLATSQVRLNGNSRAAFDHVRFDCSFIAADDSTAIIENSVTPPEYIRRSDRATVRTLPLLPVEDLSKER